MKTRWVAAGFGVVLTGALLLWFWHVQWLKSFEDGSPAVRAAAIRELSPVEHRWLLIKMLDDENADVRLLAANRLGWQRRDGERARALVRLLGDEHAGVRREAAWSLGAIGPEASPIVREALKDDNPRVRASAALAVRFAYAWKDADPWPSREKETLVPLLRDLLSDLNPEVSLRAKEALAHVDRNPRGEAKER